MTASICINQSSAVATTCRVMSICPTQSLRSEKAKPTGSGESIATYLCSSPISAKSVQPAAIWSRRWRRCASDLAHPTWKSKRIPGTFCPTTFAPVRSRRTSRARSHFAARNWWDEYRRRASTQRADPVEARSGVQPADCMDQCHCRGNDRKYCCDRCRHRHRRTCHDGILRGWDVSQRFFRQGDRCQGASALAAHVIGLTYAAKQENLNNVGRLWPLAVLAGPLLLALSGISTGWLVVVASLLLCAADIAAVRLLARRATADAVPRAVSMLIAAICLVDALAVALHGGGIVLTCVCASGYLLTPLFQAAISVTGGARLDKSFWSQWEGRCRSNGLRRLSRLGR